MAATLRLPSYNVNRSIDADGRVAMSLVQVFRVRDGRIALLRDYFRAP